MISHSWNIKSLKMFGAAENVVRILEKSMELTTGRQTLCTVNIRRRIFLRDSLAAILFVVALVPLYMVLRQEKGRV